MNSEKMIEELKCSISNDGHFLIKPIALTCGHCICRNCIPCSHIDEIRCKICDSVAKLDSTECYVAKEAQQALNFCNGDVFQIFEKETTDLLKEFKDQVQLKDEILNVRFDYIKEEIDIRVESVKIEVEEVGNRVKEKIDKMRNEFLNSNNIDTKLNDLLSSHKELQENIKSRINLNEDYLEKHQNKMKVLKDLFKEIDNYKIPLFKISIKKIDQETFGEIYSIDSNNHSNNDLLKIENKEFVRLDYRPKQLMVLPNNQLLVLHFIKYVTGITILDDNYNIIKKIDKINGEKLSHLREVAINERKGELYFSDYQNHRIIVTDFELNFIKYFGSFGGSNSSYQFFHPLGICFKNEYFYVCDSTNKRIQKFNQDLVFVNSLETKYNPFRVQVSNSMIVVASETRVYFYDLNSLVVCKEYSHDFRNFGLNLSQIDSILYCFDYKSNIFICFHENGNIFNGKIKLDEGDFHCVDGKLVFFNQTLLMSSCNGQKLIKFR